MRNKKISEIQELLTYVVFVHKAGHFVWKEGRKQGMRAGSAIPSGYREISVVRNKKRIRAYEHQIAWYLHYGTLPNHIGHKNEKFDDNRIQNLCEAYEKVSTNGEPFDQVFLAKYILTKVTYDPENNFFIWKENRQKKTKGLRCGTKNYAGYWYLKFRVNRKHYQIAEHRLIWFIHHGALPEEVDHINGVRDDNRLENLRAANRYINAQNLKSHREGKLWGVRWDRGAWLARFRKGKEQVYVGRFRTKFQAYRAVIKRARDFNIPI